MDRSQPDIQILMPAYRGEEFIFEAVHSITNQTYRNWVLDVSIDGPDEGMRRVLERFGDDRIRIHSQPDRLGWPGNYNWLVERATLPFVCYWQQDDMASHDYLEDLHARLLGAPRAAIAYSDVQWFGDWRDRTALQSIVGTPLERGLAFLEAIRYEPLRGLMRRSMIEVPAIPPVGSGDQMEFVFLTRMAIAGDFVRAENSLYFKRKHGANAFSSWVDKHPDIRLEAWTAMGAEIFKVLRDAAPPEYAYRLLCLVLDRLCVDRPGRAFWVGPWNNSSEVSIAARELARLIETLPNDIALENVDLMKPVDPVVMTAVAQLYELRRARSEPLDSKVGPEGLQPYLTSGWSIAEPWGVWSTGQHASIAFCPNADAKSVECGIVGFAPEGVPRRVEITSGGTTIEHVLMDREVEITIPITTGTRGELVTVDFFVPDPTSPFDALGHPDHRQLGIGLVHLGPSTS